MNYDYQTVSVYHYEMFEYFLSCGYRICGYSGHDDEGRPSWVELRKRNG